MTDSKGENGKFYIYDEDTGKFAVRLAIPTPDTSYYLLAFPDDFDSTGLTKISLSFDNNETFVTAYLLSDNAEDRQKVVLVYALNSKGEKGYYRFDTSSLTFVRYYADRGVQNAPEPSSDAPSSATNQTVSGVTVAAESYNAVVTQYNTDMKVRFYIIIALVILTVVLFAFVIILALKLKKLYDEYDFEDDDDEDDDDDGDDDGNDGDDGYEGGEDDFADEAPQHKAIAPQPEEEMSNEVQSDEDFRVDLSSIDDDWTTEK